jgi:hypothetical protein
MQRKVMGICSIASLPVFAFFFVACQCLADPVIVTTPIPVSGSGYYSSGFEGTEWSVSFGGTNGTDTVGVGTTTSYGIGRPDVVPPVLRAFCCGGAGIDGISSPYFYYSVGGGGGFVNIYEDSNESVLLASAPIIGYISVTSFQSSGQFPNAVALSKFAVIPTPEPWSLALVSVSLLAVFAMRARLET